VPSPTIHYQGCAQLTIGFNPIRQGPQLPSDSPLPTSPPPIPYPLFLPLCYNHPAVEHSAKRELAKVQAEPAQAAAPSAASLQGGQSPAARTEDPSRYCPVCSQRLESRRCKLICSVCGYYMSCADYY